MRRLLDRISAICAVGIACTGLESCEVDKKTTPKPPTAFSVSVNFGDGEEEWTAASAKWIDYISMYNEVNFHFEAAGQFPSIVGSVIPVGKTVFPESWSENDYLFFEYYSLNWEEVGSALWDYQLNIPYGDWQVDNGTVTITSLTSTHLSGTADLVMYDLVEYSIERNDDPARKPLEVVFNNVPLNTAMQNGAVRSAVESRDGTFSFSRPRIVPGERR